MLKKVCQIIEFLQNSSFVISKDPECFRDEKSFNFTAKMISPRQLAGRNDITWVAQNSIPAGRLKLALQSILFFFFLIPGFSFAQTKDNLSAFYSLVDSASNDVVQNLPAGSKSIMLNLNFGTEYSVFTNQVIGYFKTKGINISNNNPLDPNLTTVNITIEKAVVSYLNLFRKNFLGDFYIRRNLNLSGSYSIISKSSSVKNFHYAYADTVNYDQLKNLQNISYPFTHGEIPAEPFLSSFFEPVVAVGATALAVILFFTVRSK
ncbi:MAG: hypothetical protein ACYCVH_11820 [Ignavibacteriaceae bacterium]